MIYFVFSLLLIFFGYYITPVEIVSQNPISLNLLDSLYIFLINFTLYLVLILFSFTGFSVLFILRFIFTMGMSGKVSGIDPFVYYISSFTHGIGELILVFIVLLFSYMQFKMFYLVIKGKERIESMKQFYISALKIVIPLGLILSIVNALAEVYVSNRLILLFESGGIL